jgi:hypothetical protein
LSHFSLLFLSFFSLFRSLFSSIIHNWKENDRNQKVNNWFKKSNNDIHIKNVNCITFASTFYKEKNLVNLTILTNDKR